MFTRDFDRRMRIAGGVIAFSLILGGAFGRTRSGRQPRNRLRTKQPIDFSHKIMAGDFKIACTYCTPTPRKVAPRESLRRRCAWDATGDQPKNPDGSLRPGIVQLLKFWETKEPIRGRRSTISRTSCTSTTAGILRGRDVPGVPRRGDDDAHEAAELAEDELCLSCHTQPPPAGSPPERTTRRRSRATPATDKQHESWKPMSSHEGGVRPRGFRPTRKRRRSRRTR